MITKEQKEYYFKHNGFICPFCYSSKIDSGPINLDTEPYATVTCVDCKKQWTDIYKLEDIEEV